MTMKHWIEALDNQIIAHKRKVLIGKGDIFRINRRLKKPKKSLRCIANEKWNCWKAILIKK